MPVVLLLLLLPVSGVRGDFEGDVLPFLERHCLDCHEGDSGKGNIRFDGELEDMNLEETANLWMAVLDQLQADLMPPERKRRPRPEDQRALIRWVEEGLAGSPHGKAYFGKLLLPEYGNRVDHERLFGGENREAPFTPSRLWRVSPAIFSARNPRAEANPFVLPTRETGLRDFSATSAVDQSTIESISIGVNDRLSSAILQAKGGVRKVFDSRQGKERSITVRPNPRHRYAPFTGDTAPTEGQMMRLVEEEFFEVFRRPPRDAERDRYVTFLAENAREAGPLEAMKATMLAIHLSPEAIYRSEIGRGDPDEFGRRRLDGEELLFALGYALDDSNPLDEPILVEALENGELETKEGIAATVRMLLNRPDRIEGRGSGGLYYTWSNPRILRFFREYFGYARAPQVFKDLARRKAELGKRSPSTRLEVHIVRDLDNLIRWIVRRDRDVLRELLTTDRFLVGHPGDNALMGERHDAFVERLRSGEYGKGRSAESVARAAREAIRRGVVPYESTGKLFAEVQLYGLPVGEGNRQEWSFVLEQPLSLPHRKGVLTHPAWLWAHSTNFDTDPIHRGLWIYTRLLAGVVPDVPPDVDARVPEDPHKTLRERLDVVREEACWKCHRRMNPLGETFEIFDDWGRYRDMFYFDESKVLVTNRDGQFEKKRREGKLTSRPIDASGFVVIPGESLPETKVADAFELIDRLADSPRVRQSFIRHVFRFFLGRNELLGDSRTLVEAERDYLENDGSFSELIVSLLTSDSFLYRK